jgi:hypothetical protein
MKKLTSKIKILEAKALRKLHKKSASEHARQAAKFREDSMKLGAMVHQTGENIYKIDHPVYVELVQPLLMQATQIANKYGFNVLYQTHTPLPGMPLYSAVIGSIDSKTVTPTMQGCIDFIKSRPEAKINKDGTPMVTTVEKPFANDTAIEVMAMLLYEEWVEEAGYVEWVPGGNSDRQENARRFVRQALAAANPAPASDTDSESL